MGGDAGDRPRPVPRRDRLARGNGARARDALGRRSGANRGWSGGAAARATSASSELTPAAIPSPGSPGAPPREPVPPPDRTRRSTPALRVDPMSPWVDARLPEARGCRPDFFAPLFRADRLLPDSVEVPAVRDALQLVRPSVLEDNAGSRCQVFHGRGDEHL
jgi:hypothetical protein